MKHFDEESKAIYKSLLHVLFQSGDSLRKYIAYRNVLLFTYTI